MKRNRILLCALIMLLFFVLLAFRLWQVQVLQGYKHQQLTLRQSIRPLLLNPVRGKIITRDGTVMADCISKYDLVAHVSEMRKPGRPANTIKHIIACEKMLAMTIGRKAELTEEKLKRHLYRHPVMPLELFKDLNQEELAKSSEMLPPIPGIQVIPRIERRYKMPGIATQLLGFTGKKLPEQKSFAEDFARIYVSPDLTGRDGLEAYYDEILTGKAGIRTVKVDSLGYVFEDIKESLQPRHGNNIILTIDANAQKAADAVLQGYKGALVLISVNSGAILAMASAPTYNAANLSTHSYAALLRDTEGKPLFNRAVNGMYTPGSIVKPLIALAALQTENVAEEEEYFCSGRFMVGNHAIRCAKRGGHGWLALKEAVTFSCNPYFMDIACDTGIDKLQNFFAAAGFGEKTGIDFPEFHTGILPERSYANKALQRNWLKIDTAYVALGQGLISNSPLQAAVFTAALANGGIVYRPYLMEKITSPEGKVLQQTAAEIRHRLPASEENLNIIKEAMIGAVYTERATATGLQDCPVSLAAKTGTAEIGSGENRRKDTWVICYGPVEKPEFAAVCLIEDGDTGGRTAVPLMAFFLKSWLQASDSRD